MTTQADQSKCRIAVGNDRAKAAALIAKERGIDLLEHEKRSGAEVSFVAWPAEGDIQSAAALVLHGDGTAFVHFPTDAPNEDIVSALYSGIKNQATERKADVVLAMVPPQLAVFEPQLIANGYEHVSDVLTMQCKSRVTVRALAGLSPKPIHIEENDAGDARLAELIQATYVESLSDPALGPNASATDFLTRLRSESANKLSRFVLQVDDRDAAVCLISQYKSERYLVVRYVGVHPEFRGRKLGAKVLAGGLAAVWSNRYRYASVDVDESNHFAVNLYSELSFQTHHRAAEFMLPLERR